MPRNKLESPDKAGGKGGKMENSVHGMCDRASRGSPLGAVSPIALSYAAHAVCTPVNIFNAITARIWFFDALGVNRIRIGTGNSSATTAMARGVR